MRRLTVIAVPPPTAAETIDRASAAANSSPARERFWVKPPAVVVACQSAGDAGYCGVCSPRAAVATRLRVLRRIPRIVGHVVGFLYRCASRRTPGLFHAWRLIGGHACQVGGRGSCAFRLRWPTPLRRVWPGLSWSTWWCWFPCLSGNRRKGSPSLSSFAPCRAPGAPTGCDEVQLTGQGLACGLGPRPVGDRALVGDGLGGGRFPCPEAAAAERLQQPCREHPRSPTR